MQPQDAHLTQSGSETQLFWLLRTVNVGFHWRSTQPTLLKLL